MTEENSINQISDARVNKLLHELSSADPGPAWTEFLDLYTSLIMSTVRQFEYEKDNISECFLAVCGKLSDNAFQRLQKFNTAGKARFQTWLATVVFNLCVDWHREEYGRATVLPAISALPAFDQLVYHYSYELGMSRETCYLAINTDFPDITKDQFADALLRVHSLLTSRQRWQLSVRNQGRKRTREGSSSPSVELLQHPGIGPEMVAQNEQELAFLQLALSRLNTDQQLLLHLRFQEGLTFNKIAKLEQLGNAHAARRHIQAALDALFLQLRQINSQQKRQN